MALTPEQQAAYDEAVSSSLSQINGSDQQQAVPAAPAPVSSPVSAPIKSSSGPVPAPASPSNIGSSPPLANNLNQAMENVTNSVTQGQNSLASNMQFPEAKSPNEDMFNLAKPYLEGAAGLLTSLYGGKKILDKFGTNEAAKPKVEPSMEGQESHEDYMQRMEREERLHQVRLAKAKADEAEAKIQAAKGGPASTEAPAENTKLDLMAQIEKEQPHIAKAIKEGRVSIADETAAATQQTEPMSNAGNAPAPETPKNEAPTETVEPTTKVESATESGGQTATKDQNVPKSKTATPKGAAVPTTTQGHPELEPLKGFYDPDTGLFKSTEVGTLDQGFKNRFGNDERIKFIKELNGGKRLGSPTNTESYNDELNALGDKWVKYKQENNLPVTDKREDTIAKRNAFVKENVANGMLESDAKAAAEAKFPHTSNGMALGRKAKIGGILGLALTGAELANASPSQQANVAGESAIGMMPPALQAALYSKEATSPEELEFERKNNAASKEAIKKRQEAAPRLYKSIGPAGAVAPY